MLKTEASKKVGLERNEHITRIRAHHSQTSTSLAYEHITRIRSCIDIRMQENVGTMGTVYPEGKRRHARSMCGPDSTGSGECHVACLCVHDNELSD
jgi:phage tail protein X